MATRQFCPQMYVPRRIELATKIFINLPIFVRKCLSKQYRSTCWFIFSDPTSLETSGHTLDVMYLRVRRNIWHKNLCKYYHLSWIQWSSFLMFFKILLKVHSLPINELSQERGPIASLHLNHSTRQWWIQGGHTYHHVKIGHNKIAT